MSIAKTLIAILAPASAGFGIYWATKRASEVKQATVDAIVSGGAFDARLTGYWPFVEGLDAKARLMEGGVRDRKENPLHTLEMHQKDRNAHPFVSVAGDYEIFPYGQRIEIDQWPGLIFRVVDTGGHFHGTGKLYRVAGREPLDICVASSETHVPKLARVTIVKGDVLDKKGNPVIDMNAAVALSKFQGQTVTGLVGIDAFTQRRG